MNFYEERGALIIRSHENVHYDMALIAVRVCGYMCGRVGVIRLSCFLESMHIMCVHLWIGAVHMGKERYGFACRRDVSPIFRLQSKSHMRSIVF